jgi:membrane fusion protein, multidrug efflux system
VVIILLFGVAIVSGVRYYLHAQAYEATDDAFIQAHVVPVSAKVSSNVARVLIDDNQHVQQGELLVELDPRDYATGLAQARANLIAGKMEVRRAELEARRIRALISERAVSRQDVDNALARERTALTQVAQLDAAARTASLDSRPASEGQGFPEYRQHFLPVHCARAPMRDLFT